MLHNLKSLYFQIMNNYVQSTVSSSETESDSETVVDENETSVRVSESLLEDQHHTIAILKKAAFNASQQVQKYAQACKEKKQKRMLELDKIQKPVVNGNGRDPLIIFPEEIWRMIFKYLKNWEDLKRCSESCQLYWNILEQNKPAWMFSKVFPQIFFKLEPQEAIGLRLVCKQWKSAVDNFSLMHNQIMFPLTPAFKNKLLEMKNHSKNPFIGHRFVFKEAFNPVVSTTQQKQDFILQVQDFLETFGVHIWALKFHLSLEYLTLSGIAQMLLDGIRKCKNLKEFYVHVSEGENPMQFISRRALSILLAENLNVSPSLKVLSIEEHPYLRPIQDRMLQVSCRQLEHLTVSDWNDLVYPRFQWDNLVRLSVSTENGDKKWPYSYAPKFLKNLNKIEMPKLTTLTITLGRGNSYLLDLIKVTHKFSKLEALYLDFTDTMQAFSKKSVASISSELVASSSLKCLGVKYIQADYDQDFSFLILFPFIEKLVISREIWTSGSDIHYEIGKKDEEIVQIVNILLKNESMFKSNVWEILPLLRKIHTSCVDVVGTVQNNIYTRLDYGEYKAKSNKTKI